MAGTERSSIHTSISPWLSVKNGPEAVKFYQAAFGAVETYRLETPDGLIARLSVDGAEFWISGGSVVNDSKLILGGDTIRMILVVSDPFPIFAMALQAGAREVFPIGEDHGWLLGRLIDPFGLHWEIGHSV